MFLVASGSNQVNYDQKCFTWVKNEWTNIDQILLLNSATLACPCGLHLATLDYRWTQDTNQSNTGRYCFYERTPSTQATQVLHYVMFSCLINAVVLLDNTWRYWECVCMIVNTIRLASVIVSTMKWSGVYTCVRSVIVRW